MSSSTSYLCITPSSELKHHEIGAHSWSKIDNKSINSNHIHKLSFDLKHVHSALRAHGLRTLKATNRLRNFEPEQSKKQSDYIHEDSEWLLIKFSESLQNEGLDKELSSKISSVSCKAYKNFTLNFGSNFDLLILMDAMEEEIERNDLRGDFLPFELPRKAVALLQSKWSEERRVLSFDNRIRENNLDYIDYDKLPNANGKVDSKKDDNESYFLDE